MEQWTFQSTAEFTGNKCPVLRPKTSSAACSHFY